MFPEAIAFLFLFGAICSVLVGAIFLLLRRARPLSSYLILIPAGSVGFATVSFNVDFRRISEHFHGSVVMSDVMAFVTLAILIVAGASVGAFGAYRINRLLNWRLQ
jgi:hypothetical protein